MSTASRWRPLPLLMLLVLPATVIFVDLPGGWRWTEVLQDTGHVPAFALLTVCLARARRAPLSMPLLLRSIAVAVLLGAAVEAVQLFLGRDATLADIGRDGLGALAAGALLYANATPPPAAWRRRLARALLGGAVLLALWPLLLCARAYAHRQLAFPVLADFASPLDLYFLRPVDPPFERACIERAADAASCRRWAIHAPYAHTTWAGPVFEELPPDWRGQTALCIELSNPHAAPFTLVVALQDRAYSGRPSDRYTGSWRIAAHATRVLCLPLAGIRITPGGRPLDLGRLQRLAIAQDDISHVDGFRLHRVWLQ